MNDDDGNEITREALYELVWSTPMIKVAEKCEVSGSYLARVCTELRVPCPERGYWANRWARRRNGQRFGTAAR